jgi:hypothetical protein
MEKNNKTLMQRFIEAGYSAKDIFHHESDLYVFVTPITTRVINEWCKETEFDKDWHCPIFVDQITGKQMYDCAFQYYTE